MDPHLVQMFADDWPERGVVRTFAVPQPALGVDWTFTVPGESVLGVLSITATLTTSAVVNNRSPVAFVTDGSNALFRVGPGAVVPATTTVIFSWLPELGYRDTATNANTQLVGLPPLYLSSGQQFGVATTLRDVNDQWSGVVIVAYEVFHGRREHERSIASAITDQADALAELIGGNL